MAWRWELGALLACALAIRLGLAWGVQRRVEQTPGRLCLVAGDAEGYWELARSLVERGEFTLYTPPRRVLRMPGFPLWLAAGMQVFGEQVVWHRLSLAVLGTAACGLTCLLGCLLGGWPVGRCAGWLAAFHPGLAGLSVLLLSETLFAVCVTTSLICLARLVHVLSGDRDGLGDVPERPVPEGGGLRPPAALTAGQRFCSTSVMWGGLCGLMCGVATLVRPTWLPIAPVAVALLWWTTPGPRSRLVGPAVALMAGLLLALGPWIWRNQQVVGHPVVTSLWSGPSLYDGLHRGATGVSDMRFVEEDGLFQKLSEYEVDRHYRQAAVEYVWKNPQQTLALAGIKLRRFWNPVLNAGELDPGPVGWLMGLWEISLWMAAAGGLWQWRRSVWRLCLSAGPILFFSLVHCVFIGSVRYRLPAEYPLLAAAATGWLSLWGSGRRFVGPGAG